MKIRRLAAVGVLGLATALALPLAAEAGHRHSRSCGHSGYYSGSYGDSYYGDSYYGGSYGRGGYGYSDYGRRCYRPSHSHYRRYYSYEPYYYAPPPVYYAPRYHRRPRVQLHLGFGY